MNIWSYELPKFRNIVQMVGLYILRKPYEERKEIVNYYPAHEQTTKLMRRLRYYGLYRDEHEDFKEEMERLRKIRGKSRNRKGKAFYDPVEEDE